MILLVITCAIPFFFVPRYGCRIVYYYCLIRFIYPFAGQFFFFCGVYVSHHVVPQKQQGIGKHTDICGTLVDLRGHYVIHSFSFGIVGGI